MSSPVLSYDILQHEEEIIRAFVHSVWRNKYVTSRQGLRTFNAPAVQYRASDGLNGARTLVKRKYEDVDAQHVSTLSSLATCAASMDASGYFPSKPDEMSSDSSLDSVDGGSDGLDENFELPRKRRTKEDKVRKPLSQKTSKYRGVSLRNGKWVARITENGSQKYLGYYSTEREAGLSYNQAALRIHGEAAILNEIVTE
ncbi:hypothetical protein SeMB42_g02787 [Synchytrium endobioticum]|uniref:AP2/ERF domain-containing protein n=1 Tax=Synchytrium endobioticum TaxID=286115 RepID=A0A507D0F6_9FUNG|nr:hypothetical protein SeLEV6574_g04220 [Synchytrium endobioticum]TPX48999.1 hypothetical protein SeMB42_g02787 [Synchytrium endobioticum]